MNKLRTIICIILLLSTIESHASDLLEFIPAIITPANQTLPENTVVTKTGRVWMDRNLGASRVARSLTDKEAFGDLYQWGRLADGHEKRTSPVTTILSFTDVPGHGNFIAARDGNPNWRKPFNMFLWQGVNGINNPCPKGFRIPTTQEFREEIKFFQSNDAEGAFASPLKLTMAGSRLGSTGQLDTDWQFYSVSGAKGTYWTSTKASGTMVYNFSMSSKYSSVGVPAGSPAYGYSIRCIMD